VSGQRAVYSVWALVTLARASWSTPSLTGDFRFAYVAEHSNRSMPMLYSSRPGGADRKGRCCWSWLLSTYAAVVAFTNRRKHRDMMPYVVAVLATVQTFFFLKHFIANPFQMLATDKLIVAVPDGKRAQPAAAIPAMAIHPPMLYLGYVGFAVALRISPSVADHAPAGAMGGSIPHAAGRW